MKPNAWMAAGLLAVSLASGCVERRYIVNTDPPAAEVYRNNVPINTSPADDQFVYYGKYHFTIVKDGFETLQVDQNITVPWYEIPPFDFVSENLIPWKIRDVRTFNFQLQPVEMIREDDIVARGGELRQRGQGLRPLGPDGKPLPPVAPQGAPVPGQPALQQPPQTPQPPAVYPPVITPTTPPTVPQPTLGPPQTTGLPPAPAPAYPSPGG